MPQREGVDIELGYGQVSRMPPATRNTLTRFLSPRRLLSTGVKAISRKFSVDDSLPKGLRQIEDYPAGYPQFSALIGSHGSFLIGRRFSQTRARMLLLKQDRIVSLERNLLKFDQEETIPIRLGSCRRDDNKDRASTLAELDQALRDYDEFIIRSNTMSQLQEPSIRSVSSLRNWVNGNGSVARGESAFLNHDHDLINVASNDETILPWLQPLMEDLFIWVGSFSGEKSHRHGHSRNPQVHIPVQSFIGRVCRIIMTPFIITVLLAPVIVCSYLSSIAARLCAIVVATTSFVGILSASSRAKPIELIVAGATYATVLVVFISNEGLGEA